MSAIVRTLAAGAALATLAGCGLLAPPPVPHAPRDPLAGARTIGTTMILPTNPAADIGLWTAIRGETAEHMLKRWANTAGYTVHWRAGANYLVAANAAIAGTFAQAVTVAFNQGWPGVSPALKPMIHTENNIVVVRQDTP